MPSRDPINEQSAEVKHRLKRVDTVMAKLKNGLYYENMCNSDDVIGIDRSEWDDRDRSYERRSFFSLLGLNTFNISICEHNLGYSSKHAVVFWVETGAALTSESVQDCRIEAQIKAPHFLSQRETREAMFIMQSATDMSTRLALAK